MLDKIICGSEGVALFCVCVCGGGCMAAQYVHLFIKRLSDRNIVFYFVHLENNITQKLFLTCPLCSIWSISGGERQGDTEKACV